MIVEIAALACLDFVLAVFSSFARSLSVGAPQVLHYQIPFFYLGHFSKFLPPGSVRVGTHTTNFIEAVAFRTPSAAKEIVVVVMNRSPFDLDFKLLDGNAGSAGARSVVVKLEKHSIMTFSYPEP